MQIEHIALNVPDPVAMAAWYTQHLDMRVLRRVDQAPFTHFLADSTGRTVLEIYQHTRAPIPDYFALDPLTLHIALLADDVPAEKQRLLATGATSEGDITTTPVGDVMTFLRDPWGVTLQLVKRSKPLGA